MSQALTRKRSCPATKRNIESSNFPATSNCRVSWHRFSCDSFKSIRRNSSATALEFWKLRSKSNQASKLGLCKYRRHSCKIPKFCSRQRQVFPQSEDPELLLEVNRSANKANFVDQSLVKTPDWGRAHTDALVHDRDPLRDVKTSATTTIHIGTNAEMIDQMDVITAGNARSRPMLMHEAHSPLVVVGVTRAGTNHRQDAAMVMPTPRSSPSTAMPLD